MTFLLPKYLLLNMLFLMSFTLNLLNLLNTLGMFQAAASHGWVG